MKRCKIHHGSCFNSVDRAIVTTTTAWGAIVTTTTAWDDVGTCTLVQKCCVPCPYRSSSCLSVFDTSAETMDIHSDTIKL